MTADRSRDPRPAGRGEAIRRSRRAMLAGGLGAVAALLGARLGSAPSVRAGTAPDFGVYRGIVTDNKDPDKLARIKVKVPVLFGEVSVLAQLVSPYAGDGVGLYALPEVDDQVLVGFMGGDIDRPYVLGALWGTGEAPPVGGVDTRVLVAPGGSLAISDAIGNPGIKVTSSRGIVFEGTTSFSRSGRLVIAKGRDQGTRSRVALTASSLVLAVLQEDRPGIAVRSVVPDVPGKRFTVHLNRVVPADTAVAWFIIG